MKSSAVDLSAPPKNVEGVKYTFKKIALAARVTNVEEYDMVVTIPAYTTCLGAFTFAVHRPIQSVKTEVGGPVHVKLRKTGWCLADVSVGYRITRQVRLTRVEAARVMHRTTLMHGFAPLSEKIFKRMAQDADSGLDNVLIDKAPVITYV